MTSEEIVVDATRPQQGFNLRELWLYRDLLVVLVRRDISVRYRQTVLGVLWAVLQPLSTMLVFTLVFGRLARLPSDGVPYSLFAFSGLLPWIFFASALSAVGNSVVNSSNLITKVYFPRLIVPMAALGAPLVDLMISTVFMVLLMLWLDFRPGWEVIWLPFLYLLVALIALGIGTLIAALMAAYRDFRHLLQPLITFWMFLTPVIYPPELVPQQWRWLLCLNPMAGVVGAIRSAWFGRSLDVAAISTSLGIAILMLWLGVSYFRSVERRFADII